MIISAIAAMSENRVIGQNNQLPWHLPADLRHFKQVTLGKPVLMGRKTFESIGRPLPGRKNIIVSRDAEFNAPGCVVVDSIEAGLVSVAEAEEIFVIGGATIYEQMLPQITRLYLTIVHRECVGDAFFPELDWDEWREIERVDFEADAENPERYSFLCFERVEVSCDFKS